MARPASIVLVPILLALFLLAPLPVRADQTDKRLDGLFAALKDTKDPIMAQRFTDDIWRIWFETDNKAAREALAAGETALADEDYDAAQAAFSRAIAAAPKLAEAWNRRATVRYDMGDFEGSVHDIEETLKLEPRHFGALAGLGLIYLQIGKEGAALRAFKQALAIDPHIDDIRARVEELEKKAQGKPI